MEAEAIVRQCVISSSESENNNGESDYSADEADISLSNSSAFFNDSHNDHGLMSETRSETARSGGSGTETASATSSSVTLLDILKAPTASDLSRKRSVARNPQCGKKRSRARSNSFNPKTIKPLQRVKEYKDEPFTVSNCKLFCKACREEISVKKSSIENHLKSQKHHNGKQKMRQRAVREGDIAESLAKYNNDVHPKGETLPVQQQVFRVKVMQTFLQAGVPLNKIAVFRDFLEETGYRLCDRRTLYDLIPFIVEEEVSRIKSEIKGKRLGVIFDGTTHVCEAFAIVVRFVSDSWSIEQRLIKIQLLAKALTGEEVARELISILSAHYGITTNDIVGVMRDRASVNNVAMRTLRVVYPVILDVGCFSHTLNLVGDHFKLPNLLDFLTSWLLLFSHSTKAKFLWKQQTGKTMPTYSHTRWWSKWEVMNQLLMYFGDVKPFLLQHTDIGPQTRPKLLAYFDDSDKIKHVKLELAAVVDYGEPFVKATCNLEGDGLLALSCYETVQSIVSFIEVDNAPNLKAIVRGASSSIAVQQLKTYAKQCIQPGLDYFSKQLQNSLKIPLAAFKAARLFNPCKAREIKPNASSVDQLTSFPFITTDNIANMKSELPQYLASCEDLDESYDVLQWWKSHESVLPQWAITAKCILAIQPSSAAVERVFSLVNSGFDYQQEQSLQDYIEASVMLRFNKQTM